MSMDLPLLSSAVLHAVKNHLAELQLRLAARGDAASEQMIVAECARQLRSLLLVQRDQVGQMQASIDAHSPADLLADLVAEYAVLFPALTLDCDSADAPDPAFYDAFLLRLALDSAMHNACRHAHTRVSLSARADGDGVMFEVRDDGPGFPPELLVRDLTELATPGASGTGMGLYLAARIAALHGLRGQRGRILLTVDHGAVFRLYLP